MPYPHLHVHPLTQDVLVNVRQPVVRDHRMEGADLYHFPISVHRGQFQATVVKSLNMELRGNAWWLSNAHGNQVCTPQPPATLGGCSLSWGVS